MKKINDLRSIEAGFSFDQAFGHFINEFVMAYGSGTYTGSGTIFFKPIAGPSLDLTVALSDNDFIVPIKGSFGKLSFDLTGIMTSKSSLTITGMFQNMFGLPFWQFRT